MTKNLRSRVLALAGLLQALKLVRQIADTGHADAASERAVLWRQMGGSYWDFALRRRAMMAAIEAELE